MAMQFLHAIFRFRYFKHSLSAFLFLFLFAVMSTVSKVHAEIASGPSYVWFTVYNGGILSGYQGTGVGVYDYIPSSVTLPAGFKRVAIQGDGVGSAAKPSAGVIVTFGDQAVKAGTTASKDAYAKYTGLTFTGIDFNALYNSITSTLSSGCSGMLNNGNLEPGTWYRTRVSCAESALNNASTPGYRLRSDGVLVLVAQKESSTEVLNINGRVRSKGGDSQRVMVITDADILISHTVGTLPAGLTSYVNDYYDDVDPDVQLAFITTGKFTVESESFFTDAAIILEGPIAASGDVILSRNLGTAYNFPGVYVKYNPLYISWISSGYSGLSGMFNSKTTWRYE